MEGEENFENNNNETQNEENENEYQDEMSPEQENEVNDIMYIYEWVDSIPLSRQKKNIARDFNDAVLLAEMIKYHYPRLVDLHNYPSASSTKHKLSNWNTLNNKVLKKLGLRLHKNEIEDVINCKPNAIELLLKKVYYVIQKHFGNDNIREQVEKNSHFNLNNPVGNMKKKIQDKENVIKELSDTISVLEMKLKSTLEYNQNLESKINEFEEKIREKGFDI